eukprot:g24592.t1
MKDGAFALAKAHYASSGDDIASSIVERAKKPSVTTKMYPDNAHTMGVGSGGAVLNATRDTYLKAVECIVQLASLQTAFHTLDEEIKMTSRRVNALEYVLIPRIEVVEKKKVKLAKEKEQAEKNEARAKAPSILQKKDADIALEDCAQDSADPGFVLEARLELDWQSVGLAGANAGELRLFAAELQPRELPKDPVLVQLNAREAELGYGTCGYSAPGGMATLNRVPPAHSSRPYTPRTINLACALNLAHDGLRAVMCIQMPLEPFSSR